MTKIILNGAGGRMGAAVREQVSAGADDTILTAQIDKFSEEFDLHNIADYKGEADVIIDFSHHSAVRELISYALGHSLPIVLSTTGHTEDEKALIYEAAKSVPVFYSANMSLGIAVLADFARRAAALLPDADIEIVEIHHNRKLDAPSGTAQMIADELKTVRQNAEFVYGRHGMGKRAPAEIGIHALRMGNEAGTHQVILSTDYQTIRLEHKAESRAVFAEGAISAAKFLIGKPAGLYDMKSMVSLSV